MIHNLNTILVCQHWPQTLVWYRQHLGFDETFANDWFVELAPCSGARFSLLDARHTSRPPTGPTKLHLTFQVDDLETWQTRLLPLNPGPIQTHPWDARLFTLSDPEGHVLEFWQPT